MINPQGFTPEMLVLFGVGAAVLFVVSIFIKRQTLRGDKMKLGVKQELFMRLLPRLIDKAHSLGFEVRGGDLFRDPRVHGEYGQRGGYGAANSNHKLKCAIDLNLFRDGQFLATTEAHKELGEWWEQQHELCRWGGNFKRADGTPSPDGNHYELR